MREGFSCDDIYIIVGSPQPRQGAEASKVTRVGFATSLFRLAWPFQCEAGDIVIIEEGEQLLVREEALPRQSNAAHIPLARPNRQPTKTIPILYGGANSLVPMTITGD